MLNIGFILYKIPDKNYLIKNRFTKTNLSFIFSFYDDVKKELDNLNLEYEITLDYQSDSKHLKLIEDETFIKKYKELLKVPKYHFITDVTYNNPVKTIYYNYHIPVLKITIKYPEVLIKNDKGHKRLLKELFVSFEINQKGLITHLSGARTKRTNLEIEKGYVHSHLTSNTGLSFSNFCLGTNTPIHTAKALFMSAVQENKEINNYFSLFLNNVKSVLEYESLDGVPYIKMEDIKESITDIPNTYNLFNACKQYISFLSSLSELNTTSLFKRLRNENIISFHNLKLNIVNQQEFEQIIFYEILNKNERYFDLFTQDRYISLFIIVLYNGEKLSIKDMSYRIKYSQYFYFNRQKQYLKLDDNIGEIDKSLVTYELDTSFKMIVSQYFKNELYHKSLEQYHDEKRRQESEAAPF